MEIVSLRNRESASNGPSCASRKSVVIHNPLIATIIVPLQIVSLQVTLIAFAILRFAKYLALL